MNFGEFKGSVMGRIVILGGLYAAGLIVSLWLAYQIRFDFQMPEAEWLGFYTTCLWAVPLKLVLLFCFRQMQVLLGYFSIPGLVKIGYAMFFGSASLWLVRWESGHTLYAPPRGVILADFIVSLGVLVGLRLALRLWRERHQTIVHSKGYDGRIRRVGIMGAGDAGVLLSQELVSKRGLGLYPVAFFDDDAHKWHSRVHNIPVVGSPEVLFNGASKKLRLDEIIIAMPSAPAKRIAEVVKVCQQCHLKFETVPSLEQMATGKVKVSQIRPVEIDDLLGRPPVQLETENIQQLLKGQVIMVTGAGGSIGSELCRQIVTYQPQQLLLIERSEVQLFPIEQELIDKGHSGILVPLVADILDAPRMRSLFERFRPHLLFHAAAHKHVPMMENQPSEAIKNNTIGTARLAELARIFGVQRFVMISTDKAINPTNVMGATKRLAETYVQALHAYDPQATKFMAVRFGNVLGSSGSVIPLFKAQIAAGGPVKVTHPEITRYFMTIPEAVGLVLQCGTQGTGGEIFMLDMGKPVKIVDLARQLIELSGFKPGIDIEIQFVGLRPGEKLFEELSYQGEQYSPTHHPKIMRLTAQPNPYDTVVAVLEKLEECLDNAEADELKLLLREAVPDYKPYLSMPPGPSIPPASARKAKNAGELINAAAAA